MQTVGHQGLRMREKPAHHLEERQQQIDSDARPRTFLRGSETLRMHRLKIALRLMELGVIFHAGCASMHPRLRRITSAPYSLNDVLEERSYMGKITAILQTAQQRAKEMNLPYEGALYPDEAHEVLQSAPGARLVDVRTRAELDWVGRVPGAAEIEWAIYPGMKPNPNFVAQLEQQVDKEALVLFICRSGMRSNAAATAATKAGYGDCYNVLEGFEGEKDGDEHRNMLGGWRVAGLPWEQS